LAYVGLHHNLKDLKDHGAGCGSFLRKGEVLAYVGLIHNLKDLKAWFASGAWMGTRQHPRNAYFTRYA